MLRDARRGRVELSEMLGSNPPRLGNKKSGYPTGWGSLGYKGDSTTHLGGDSFFPFLSLALIWHYFAGGGGLCICCICDWVGILS